MPGLENLIVSLTKNGYFKVAKVLEAVPADQVLSNLGGQIEDVRLADSQVANMLSADASNRLPELWNEVRAMGPQAIRALTFISIIFSHHTLITGLARSRTAEMQGVLRREDYGEKVFTNLVYSMGSMGLCTVKNGATEVPYNLAPLFRELQIGPLAKRLLKLKLEKTEWKEPAEGYIFLRDFYEQCAFYGFHDTLAISPKQFHDWLEGLTVEYEKPPVAVLSPRTATVSTTLITALAAKPFVIISGPTGTGKTMTARQLASNLKPDGVPDSFNHVFIPVEAGWMDGRHLLGYKNPFGKSGETYSSTPLIQLLLKANYPDYASIPFFVILDEMNLSHVEMYFSRFLSVMETAGSAPESLLGEYELELLHAASMSDPVVTTYAKSALDQRGLFLTRNVFIIGTVNVDETTHMFSPKVLDRAFVLECPAIKPSETGTSFALPEEDRSAIDAKELAQFLLKGRTNEPDRSFDEKLDAIYALLGRYRFGPRVTTECHRYIAASRKLATIGKHPGKFAEDEAILDRLSMQKVLPKLHGNRSQILAVLDELSKYSAANKLLLSTTKIDTMLGTLKSLGFTNYFA
ncbi:McrB family protein [Geminisphaera colitermitum]|uniref:McrB family protein n=1 Tax=Geminisphaera colitermitum TaxID=1148786 RepID=UPI000158C5FB|nr:hypothetical protein [Geminisphaera colitermitum]